MQLTMFLSGMHRATGLALTALTMALAAYALFSKYDVQAIADYIQDKQVPRAMVNASKALIIWPLAYHTVNGVRHLVRFALVTAVFHAWLTMQMWNWGYGLSLRGVYVSGYMAVAASFILTAAAFYPQLGAYFAREPAL